MAHETTVPDITEVQLRILEEMFPNAAPDIETPDRKVWFNAGCAHVVKFLREQYRRQNEPDKE